MGVDERGRAQNGSLRTTYDDFYDPDGWVWSDRVVDGQVQGAVDDARMLPEQAARIRPQANVDDAVRQLRAVQVQCRRFMRVGGEGRMFRTCDQCLQPLQQRIRRKNRRALCLDSTDLRFFYKQRSRMLPPWQIHPYWFCLRK